MSSRRPLMVFALRPFFARHRVADYRRMMDRLAELYDLECQETGEDPRRRFMTDAMPPLTNVACHPRR